MALLDAMQTRTVEDNRPRPARWRLQVRLRRMMAAITGLCILLGSQVNRVHREQCAIRTLIGQGVNVVVASSAPEWLPDALDGAWFQTVIAVNTPRTTAKASGAVRWHAPRRAADPVGNVEIFVYICPYQRSGPRPDPPLVSEELLSTVAALSECKILMLDHSPISDAGLKHLRRLPRLQYLNLSNTRITDEAVADLAQMRRLAGLNLRGTQVSDDGIACLRHALPACRISR